MEVTPVKGQLDIKVKTSHSVKPSERRVHFMYRNSVVHPKGILMPSTAFGETEKYVEVFEHLLELEK